MVLTSDEMIKWLTTGQMLGYGGMFIAILSLLGIGTILWVIGISIAITFIIGSLGIAYYYNFVYKRS